MEPGSTTPAQASPNPNPNQGAAAAASGKALGNSVYEASGGRKFVLGFVFVLLLPFVISLPVMVIERMARGLLADAMGLAIFALPALVLVLMLLNSMLFSFRTRIELGGTTASLTLPNWRGPTPGLSYKTRAVPFADIQSIETRGEIYKSLGTPLIMRTASLGLKGGERLTLGYEKDGEQDPSFDVRKIAGDLAARSGVPLADTGSVRAGSAIRAFIKGAPEWESKPRTDIQVATYSLMRNRFMWGVLGLFGVLLLAAIALDTINAEFGPGGAAIPASKAAKGSGR